MANTKLTVGLAVSLALHGGWISASEVPGNDVELTLRRRDEGMPVDGQDPDPPEYVTTGQGVNQTPPPMEAFLPFRQNAWQFCDDEAAYAHRYDYNTQLMQLNRNAALLSALTPRPSSPTVLGE
jgi:hypothetical protein